MRIWDVHPGYLSRDGLLGEHALLHAIAAMLRRGEPPSATSRRTRRRHMAGNPEVARWRGYGWALAQRHRLVVAEMALLGIDHKSPLVLRKAADCWPAFVDPPATQFSLLAAKYEANGQRGRIALPRSCHQLWAQHKYSVMAREQSAYRALGRRVSAMRGTNGMAALALELTSWLRGRPSSGDLRNAVAHMAGYVETPATFTEMRPPTAARTVGRLAQEQGAAFLLAQTALSDLAAWPGFGE